MYWKDLSSRVLQPISEHGRSEYPRLSKKSEKENRDEETQRSTRDNMEADESYFVLIDSCWQIASGDRRVKEWCGQIQELSRWGELSSWSLFEFYEGEHEESITVIKPRSVILFPLTGTVLLRKTPAIADLFSRTCAASLSSTGAAPQPHGQWVSFRRAASVPENGLQEDQVQGLWGGRHASAQVRTALTHLVKSKFNSLRKAGCG